MVVGVLASGGIAGGRDSGRDSTPDVIVMDAPVVPDTLGDVDGFLGILFGSVGVIGRKGSTGVPHMSTSESSSPSIMTSPSSRKDVASMFATVQSLDSSRGPARSSVGWSKPEVTRSSRPTSMWWS